MEATISGRRYWKEGEQWYRWLLDEDRVVAGSHRRYFCDDHGYGEWEPVSQDEIGKTCNECNCDFDYRAPCDDPTLRTIVKEGDTVSTPMGPGKVVKPKSGSIQPVFIAPKSAETIFDYGRTDALNEIARSLRGPAIVLDLHEGPPLEFFVDEFVAVQSYGSYSTVRLRDRGDIPVAVNGNEVLRRVREARDIIETAQDTMAKSRGAFAVATENSKPDGNSHLVKSRLLSGATEEPGSKPQQEATTSSSSSASMLSLRDQFALASLPALIQKYSGQDRFALSVTDRLTMCREAYAIAEDMMKARGE